LHALAASGSAQSLRSQNVVHGENEFSTSAVPIDINRILLASMEKHWNNARFSGWVHSIIKLSLVDKSMGKRQRNCYS